MTSNTALDRRGRHHRSTQARTDRARAHELASEFQVAEPALEMTDGELAQWIAELEIRHGESAPDG